MFSATELRLSVSPALLAAPRVKAPVAIVNVGNPVDTPPSARRGEASWYVPARQDLPNLPECALRLAKLDLVARKAAIEGVHETRLAGVVRLRPHEGVGERDSPRGTTEVECLEGEALG